MKRHALHGLFSMNSRRKENPCGNDRAVSDAVCISGPETVPFRLNFLYAELYLVNISCINSMCPR
jgi:hypothetical protein